MSSFEVHLDRADQCRACASVDICCVNHQNLSAFKCYLTKYKLHDDYSNTQWYFEHWYLIRIFCPASQNCSKVFINLFSSTRNCSRIYINIGSRKSKWLITLLNSTGFLQRLYQSLSRWSLHT